MRHTPGPWHTETDGVSGVFWVHNDDIDSAIATVYGTDEHPDLNCEANADLIASAPDLLEACKGLLDLIKKINIDGEQVESNYPAIYPAVKAALDAIDKAEGGAS